MPRETLIEPKVRKGNGAHVRPAVAHTDRKRAAKAGARKHKGAKY